MPRSIPRAHSSAWRIFPTSRSDSERAPPGRRGDPGVRAEGRAEQRVDPAAAIEYRDDIRTLAGQYWRSTPCDADTPQLALDLPGLTIIVGHACWPWTTQACALAMRCTNVYLMPDFYMHVPHMPGAGDYVGAANTYLSHRMLYSSCFPTRPLGQAVDDFRELPLAPEAQENLLWRNGARLLGLEA